MGPISLMFTSLLSLRGKAQLMRALFHVRRFGGKHAGAATVREWAEAHLSDPRAREVFEALVRLATYADHAGDAAAALSLSQLRVAMRGALYVDEGWQKIVDSMHSAAISSGVNFVTSSRVVGVVNDGAVRAIELGGLEIDLDRMDTQTLAMPDTTPDEEGTLIPADTVVLAVDPGCAATLAGPVGQEWARARPVTAACLDVALRTLPNPKNAFALGIDRPLYYAVHSAFAQLTPKGGALVHLVKYRKEQRASDEELDGSRPRRNSAAAEDEQQLEDLLDSMQPGWREHLVHRRFLPSMTVSNALVTPQAPRPSPVTSVRGLYIAGDWVGDEGILSDAALASARAAARAILA
jgi:phytoene dehydrogenase-like protein